MSLSTGPEISLNRSCLMTDADKFQFSASQPITKIEQDELGHWPLAQELASAIRISSPQAGFVLGIEGGWGSGKSSIANLVEHDLCSQEPKRHKIVRFNPWLIGTRDQLLGELFGQLIRAAAELGAPPNVNAKFWHVRYWWQRVILWFRLRGLGKPHRASPTSN